MANDRSTRTCVTSSRRLPASPGLARTRGTKSGRLSRHSGFGRRGRGMRGGSPENREPSPGVDRRASCRFLVIQLTRILPRSSRSSGATAMSCATAMRCSSAAPARPSAASSCTSATCGDSNAAGRITCGGRRSDASCTRKASAIGEVRYIGGRLPLLPSNSMENGPRTIVGSGPRLEPGLM